MRQAKFTIVKVTRGKSTLYRSMSPPTSPPRAGGNTITFTPAPTLNASAPACSLPPAQNPSSPPYRTAQITDATRALERLAENGLEMLLDRVHVSRSTVPPELLAEYHGDIVATPTVKPHRRKKTALVPQP